MSRYLEPDKYITATIYAPVSYLPSPVLIYTYHPDHQGLIVIGTGVLDSVDPDRIILKKVYIVCVYICI